MSITGDPILGATADLDVADLGKRERNKIDKRRRIVAAATALFQEKGFEHTTTAEIAAAAGIGAGTLYLYVESKEELLVSAFVNVAGDAWTGAFDLVDPAAHVVDQIMTLLVHVTEHHESDRRLARSFFKELPYVSASGRAGTDAFTGWFSNRLASLLDDASANGKLDSDIPKYTLAFNLYAIWQVLMRRLVTDRLPYDEMVKQLEDAVRVALWEMTPDA
ncbi:TetR/AcrR family transcriptional regulator [Candidatus Poriferisodalis sp.]|uniref:TetR/AcrR family transcriptional regulator n=1 Tax=Candidatus Poriferisodalis sp. TaxID=3101277 RepID=UPI003B02E655